MIGRIIGRAAEWLLDRLFTRYEIGRGADAGLYLVRWDLLGNRYARGHKLFVHRFHRSDHDEFHNHPWSFWSLILWGGYWEKTPAGRKWYRPGQLLRRKAAWRHSVEIPAGKRAWSLVWTGPKEQSWGFFCPDGFTPWREHKANLERTGDGCDGGNDHDTAA